MNHTLDMMPPEYFTAEAARQRVRIWVAIVLFAVLLIVTMHSMMRVSRQRLDGVVEPLRERVDGMAALELQLAPLTEQLARLRAANGLVDLLVREPPWALFLSAVGEAAEGRVQVRQLLLEYPENTQPPSGPGFSIAGVASGNVALIAFMNRLTRADGVDQVDLESSRSMADLEGFVEFELSGRLVSALLSGAP